MKAVHIMNRRFTWQKDEKENGQYLGRTRR